MTADNTKMENLQRLLIETTDPKEYDRLSSEIAAIQKAQSLLEAMEKKERAEKEAAEKANAIKKHKAARSALAKEIAECRKKDELLFSILDDFYASYLERYQQEIEITNETQRLTAEAALLEQPKVQEHFPPMVCNWSVQPYRTPIQAMLKMIEQYGLAISQIEDAKKRGNDHPEKPGLDWYSKGDGRYWPQGD